jgi:hypothetical protein
MNSKYKVVSFFRPSITTNDYGEDVEELKQLDDIRINISLRAESAYSVNAIIGQEWDFIGITKDKRPEKDDVIDDKLVVYTEDLGTNRQMLVYMQEIKEG